MGLIKFSGYDVQPAVHLSLQQLARALSRNARLEVGFGFHARMLRRAQRLEISRFWDTVPAGERQDGYRSDVYLKAYAETKFSDPSVVAQLAEQARDTANSAWCMQLFLLGEELRLQEAAIAERPGMSRVFAVRKRVLRTYFDGRLRYHLGRREWSDAALAMIYGMLTAEGGPPQWELPERMQQARQVAERSLYMLYEQPDTSGVAAWACELTWRLGHLLDTPCTMTYWSPSIDGEVPVGLAAPPVDSRSLRKEKLHHPSSRTARRKQSDADESFALRRREDSESVEPLLSFTLNAGPHGGWLGNRDVRQADAGDQSLAIVQGTSDDSRRSADGPDAQASLSDGVRTRSASAERLPSAAGVYPVYVQPERPDAEAIERYRTYCVEVAPLKRRLRTTLAKHLEHKNQLAAGKLHAGRLGRNLTDLWTEQLPRVFRRPSSVSPQWDAAVLVLVDCSASMADKMERVHAGLTLLHETLAALAVPHIVCGFWEPQTVRLGGSSAAERGIANCFMPVIAFERSLSKSCGAEILQLQPQDDNRDGYAIRHAAPWLLRRPERRKWMLVFTDGQPSAQDYAEAGVLDTYEAVRETRRLGVDVFGLHITGHEPSDKDSAAMRAVYGQAGMALPDLDSLPQQLHRLMRSWLTRP